MMVEVKPSPIHGCGVFAFGNIKADTAIPDNIGDEFYEEVEVGSLGWDNKSALLLPSGKALIHRLSPGSSWTEFLNHANDPNAAFDADGELYLLRDVACDEEITIDYRVTMHPESQDYKAVIKQPIIFLHIPRTGGMSLRNTMDRVFGVRNIGRPWWGTHVEEPVDREMRAKAAWYGHFHFGLHEHIGRPGIKYITILREPTERVLSEYKRNKYRERYGWAPLDLVQSNDSQAVALAGRNLMVRMLSGSNPDTPIGSNHVRVAIENLREHFCFVGFTHKYNELEAFVRNELGWPVESLPHDNKGRDEQVSDEEIQQLKTSEALRLDYELWHAVRPSMITSEEVIRLLKQSERGVADLREQLRPVFRLGAAQRNLVLD